jgi:hypothetical protein
MKGMTDEQRRSAYHNAGKAVIAALIGCPLPERVTVRKGGGRRKSFGQPVPEALVAITGLLGEGKAGVDFDWDAGDRVIKAAEAMVRGSGESADHLVEVATCLLKIKRVDAAIEDIAALLMADEELASWQVEAVCEEHLLPLARQQAAAEQYLQPTGVPGVGRVTRKATGIPLPGITQG